jgi:hypothetical protein
MGSHTHFVTTGAKSYTTRGASGQVYQFAPTKPARVIERDAVVLRRNPTLMECDEEGEPVGVSATPRPTPISYQKFEPSSRQTTSRRPEDNAPIGTRSRSR